MNAEVLVKFKGDTQNLDKETSKAQGSLKGFAGAVGTTFKVATGVIAATTAAVGALVKKSVEGYAEFEQLEGGLESLFGKGSEEMQKILAKSEQAYMDLTMSQNEYLNAFEKSYPLVNAGLSEGADSIEYTNKMLQLSSDLYNTYGGSVENYQNAINWALKGSFVYLDNLNLGIKGTQEGFIEAANSSGILSKNITDVKELTNDEIIDVIQHYAQEYGVWGKTSEEASKTIIGSMNMTKAAWSNLITGLSKDGADIDGLIDNLINSALKFAGNVMPVIMRAIKSIAQALPKIADYIGKELPGLVNDLLPPLVEAINTLINALLQALPGLLNTMIPLLTQTILSLIQSLAQNLPAIIQALLSGIITIVQALAQALPTLIPQLVTAILDGLLTILDNIDLLIDAGIALIMGLIEGLTDPDMLVKIVETIPMIITKLVGAIIINLPKIFDAAIKIIEKLIDGLVQATPKVVAKIPEICKKMVKEFINFTYKFVETGRNLVQGLINGILNGASSLIQSCKNLAKKALNSMKSALGIHSPSTEFAILGKFSVLGYTEALENMKGQVQKTIDSVFDLQPNVSGSMQNTYSPQMTVNVQNNMELDPLGQLVNNIKTFSGGAKNDYNWGASL